MRNQLCSRQTAMTTGQTSPLLSSAHFEGSKNANLSQSGQSSNIIRIFIFSIIEKQKTKYLRYVIHLKFTLERDDFMSLTQY